MVGNVSEWSSDQLTCTGAQCTGTPAASNSVDTGNGDLASLAVNNIQAPTSSNTFTTFGKIQFPIGVAIMGAYSGDGAVSLTAAQFHGDAYLIDTTAGTRAAFNGGGWNLGGQAGRYMLDFSGSSGSTGLEYGFRCAIDVD